MITVVAKGDFRKTEKFLERAKELFKSGLLDKYGRMGVSALSSASPNDTGRMANSWYYTIERDNEGVSIVWSNSDIENGVNVAVLVQYGHGTKNGGYVEGIDFVNPAMRPVFEEILDDLLREAGK